MCCVIPNLAAAAAATAAGPQSRAADGGAAWQNERERERDGQTISYYNKLLQLLDNNHNQTMLITTNYDYTLD